MLGKGGSLFISAIRVCIPLLLSLVFYMPSSCYPYVYLTSNQPQLPAFAFPFLPLAPFRFSPCVSICGFLLTFSQPLRLHLALLGL